MTERIVDLLEAVQIEHEQREADGAVAAQLLLVETLEEPATVGKPRQLVRTRLQLALRELADLGERDPGTYEGGHDRPSGKYDSQRWELHEGPEHQQYECGDGEEDRDEHYLPPGDPLGHLPRCPLPCGAGRQDEREHPEHLDGATRGVGAGRHRTGDDRVGDRKAGQCAPQQPPGLLGVPAPQPEDTGHEHEQHQVGKRVGDVQAKNRQPYRVIHSDGGRGKPARQCRHAEATHQSVKPHAGMEPGDTST